MNKKAKIIIFEGLDKVGKTTQIELLKETLEQKNKKVKIIREVDISKIDLLDCLFINERISDFQKQLLFSVARYDQYEYVRNNLDNFDFFIFDRSFYSTLQYQLSNIHEHEKETVFQLISDITRYIIKDLDIDYVFFLTMDPSHILYRISKETKIDVIEKRIIYNIEKIYQEYLQAFDKFNHAKRLYKIDCTKKTKEEILNIILSYIEGGMDNV